VRSVDTNEMQVQGNGLSKENHPTLGECLRLGETNDTVQVQESGLSKENHPTLGESLRSGETNRTAD
jgi:hypothetical protein